MKFKLFKTQNYLLIIPLLTGCVDAYEPKFKSTVNVVVVDGTITNLAEPQTVWLNRSKADSVTGRFGNAPITAAQVEVIVNGSQVVKLTETAIGKYELPRGFQGNVGSSYQLRFRLEDGTQYESKAEVLQAAPPISTINVQFNTQSLPPFQMKGFRAAHDFYLDTQDPAGEQNFYRWDWALYEKQDWCRSCSQGVYSVTTILPKTYFYNYFVAGKELLEDCFVPPYDPSPGAPQVNKAPFTYDYRCRTQCWEIIRNYNLNLFDDALTNGGAISARKVAQIPYYDHNPCLVEIRQSALSKAAFRYFKLVEAQTQNTGGLADTPPAAPIGNIYNVANRNEAVVGYFGASGVSTVRYWLDRKDANIPPYGAKDEKGDYLTGIEELFFALNDRRPNPEPTPPYTGERPEPAIQIWGGPPRVPTAICIESDGRTANKPVGWRD
jgi:hypothetical protein